VLKSTISTTGSGVLETFGIATSACFSRLMASG
jgi:hypothetical protein